MEIIKIVNRKKLFSFLFRFWVIESTPHVWLPCLVEKLPRNNHIFFHVQLTYFIYDPLIHLHKLFNDKQKSKKKIMDLMSQK